MKKIQTERIDWTRVVLSIWKERRLILIVMLSSLALGVFVAFSLGEEYTSRSVFIPQVSQSSKNSGISGLASIAGVNLGSSPNFSEIPPGLYPKIASSTGFKRELLDTKLTYLSEKGEINVTYADFYENYYDLPLLNKIKKYTVGLPLLVWKKIRGKDEKVQSTEDLDSAKEEYIGRLSTSEIGHFERLDGQLNIEPNEKMGYVQLSFSMPYPLMAAEMTLAAENILQREIIKYRIRNAEEQLKFIEARFVEKKQEFEKTQTRLADFRDRNQNLSTSFARSEQERLESEYNLAFNNYLDMAKQLENSKFQVSQDAPVFSVIDPVVVPHKRSAPNKPLVIILWLIVGGIVATAIISIRFFVKDIRELISKEANGC